jgi:hypothetical protein
MSGFHWNPQENIGNQRNMEAVFRTGCSKIFPATSGSFPLETSRNHRENSEISGPEYGDHSLRYMTFRLLLSVPHNSSQLHFVPLQFVPLLFISFTFRPIHISSLFNSSPYFSAHFHFVPLHFVESYFYSIILLKSFSKVIVIQK